MGAVYCWETTGSVRSEVLERVVLSRTRRDNCVYSLDDHAVAGELNASVEEKDSLAQGPSRVESLGSKRLFEQLCTESWITRHLTVVQTPQQNRLAECINRILMDKVCYLLIQSGFPKTFWAEATCTAAYLINRSPLSAIKKKTPMWMWSGYPGDYEMSRVFGCVAYSHVKQGKLEPRAVECVFLGFSEGVNGYRLYRLDDESPKIVTSKNVAYNESVMYKDTLKDSGAGTDKSIEELQVEVELHRLNNRTLEEDRQIRKMAMMKMHEIKKLIRHRISQIINWFEIEGQ
ncbi:retrovirus-related pol polyprotein from transposon TNT 1-94 [Tanacetum coccineum]